jgi:hypothetical protein
MAKTVSKITTDHKVIKTWVEQHGGHLARVRGTGNQNDPGILRIDFPGGSGEDVLQEVNCDQCFDKFEENHLAFLYQKKKASGEDSTFFKLIKRKG